MKHGDVNATLPDRDQVESITLDDALALLAAKSGKSGGTAARPARGAAKKTTVRAAAATKAAEPPRGQAGAGAQEPAATARRRRRQATGREGHDRGGREQACGQERREEDLGGQAGRPAQGGLTPVGRPRHRPRPRCTGPRGSRRSTACAASPCCSCSACTRPATRRRCSLGTDAIRASSEATWSESLLFWLHRSHHGVYLFFVLSGYLIGRMWWPAPRLSYRAFVWRRALRVYPAFLLAFAASLVFAFASETWQPPDRAATRREPRCS